ncbi:hypothetical protein DXG01_002932 [Tephrocybe rancida]|nr:hypothetical protein DXG01_002932 [Tephrocybe rancida]
MVESDLRSKWGPLCAATPELANLNKREARKWVNDRIIHAARIMAGKRPAVSLPAGWESLKSYVSTREDADDFGAWRHHRRYSNGVVAVETLTKPFSSNQLQEPQISRLLAMRKELATVRRGTRTTKDKKQPAPNSVVEHGAASDSEIEIVKIFTPTRVPKGKCLSSPELGEMNHNMASSSTPTTARSRKNKEHSLSLLSQKPAPNSLVEHGAASSDSEIEIVKIFIPTRVPKGKRPSAPELGEINHNMASSLTPTTARTTKNKDHSLSLLSQKPAPNSVVEHGATSSDSEIEIVKIFTPTRVPKGKRPSAPELGEINHNMASSLTPTTARTTSNKDHSLSLLSQKPAPNSVVEHGAASDSEIEIVKTFTPTRVPKRKRLSSPEPAGIHINMASSSTPTIARSTKNKKHSLSLLPQQPAPYSLMEHGAATSDSEIEFVTMSTETLVPTIRSAKNLRNY